MANLLIATNNRGKMAEFGRLLDELPFDLHDLSSIGITDEIEETGETFAKNAAIKASGYAKMSGALTLADDSGLVIDYLKGEPGVRSARYAGEGASDGDRIEKVLSQMRDVETDRRTARFVCVVALADTNGKVVHSTEGVCEGRIAFEPKGKNGFGYDPIFMPSGFDQTFAELTSAVKNEISHRALAVKKMIPYLQGFFHILT
ncbi:MAG TPA: XTP/dITP diphosphatase [Pyrinomonadaceae bacterium]|jgi:XTP/dITP diphosphohydrolase|nr:XTP/dITP diphosphatase [Pyrinomonadaceae bacterium]